MGKSQGKSEEERGKGGKGGRTAPSLTLCLFLAPFAFGPLAGCNTPKTAVGSDPLLTGGAAWPRSPGRNGPGPATGTATTQQGTGQPQAAVVPPVPGVPTSGTGLSPAALASGRLHPFDRSRDLQITDWPRGPQGGGWTAPANVPRPNPSGVMLRPPEPLGDTGGLPTPRPPPPTALVSSPASAPTGPVTTHEQAQAQLSARGVLWQKPEKVGPDEWQFSCAVRHPRNANQQRTYRARGRDLLDAMRAVLQQIDQDSRP